MKNIICILVIFFLCSECNADIRVLEQIRSKQHFKHKGAASIPVTPKLKTKSRALKPKKIQQKNAAENWASKAIKNKEIVSSEDLDIRDDIVYLPKQDNPFTGKHEQYHANAGKVDVKDSSQNESSKTGRKDNKYIEIIYKDGKKNGPITMWDENGVKIGAIYYKDGIPIE
jgi:antitoxin component YwqK of YwqJK toxin-antitoxin module